MADERLPAHWRAAGTAVAIGGAILFVWSIRAAGAQSVIEGVGRLGSGFVVVALLGGLRYVARTAAWRLCVDTPADLPYARAFAAFVAGDALGNVTPFGLLISEPSKIALVGSRVPTGAAVAALATENLFYSATVVAMLVVGTAALLLWFSVSESIRVAGIATLLGAIAAALAAAWTVVTRKRLASGAAVRLAKAGIGRRFLAAHVIHVREVEDRIFGFARLHGDRMIPILSLEIAFHTLAVFEIWFVLSSITGTAPTFMTAFVLEYVNRAITTVFQFVPMWLGVDEAGTGAVAASLNLGAATGVSLALARKARIACWTAIGILLLLYRTHRAAPATAAVAARHADVRES
jgi:hypothetical protein